MHEPKFLLALAMKWNRVNTFLAFFWGLSSLIVATHLKSL